MKSQQGWLVGLVRILAPLMVLVVVALALTWRPGGPGGTQHASADSPHAGLDFTIGVDIDTASDAIKTNDDCDTKPATGSIPNTCNIPAGNTFVLHVYLNANASVAYQGFDIFLTYTGVTSNNNPDDADFPTCGFPAFIPVPGGLRFGCTQSLGAPATTYTGAIGKTSFTCPPSVPTSGTITLNHGISDTALDGEHAEGEGTAETLAINCTTPPTNTPTSPPPTNTSLPSATFTRTPTATGTATRTPTSTPLPSEQADVMIVKTDLQDPIGSGSLLTYRLLVTNNGVVSALNVAVADFLPVEVVFDHYFSTGATCLHDGSPTGGWVNCTIGTMGPSAQVTIDIFVLTPTPTDDIRIGNVAAVTASNEPFANQNNNQDAEQTVVLAPRADLTLEKTDKIDPVNASDVITYNMVVENVGPGDAQDVVIYDNLEAGMVYNDGASSPLCDEVAPPGVDPNGTLAEVDVICNLGTVASGATVTVQIVVNAPLVKVDTIVKNIAYVSGNNELFAQTGNNLGLEDTGVIAPPPDLSIVKTGATSVRRAGFYSYKLAIQNIGGGDSFGVIVTDILPKVLVENVLRPVTLISSPGAACSLPPNSNTITCNIPFIANGASLSIVLNVRAPTVLAQANVTNTVNISDPDETLDPPGNNDSSAGTKIIACFDVTGDNVVRINDIQAIVAHYGLAVGQPGYDLLYDLDGNGRVLIRDVNLMVQHFGEGPC